jgi:hypothetical protein
MPVLAANSRSAMLMQRQFLPAMNGSPLRVRALTPA